MGHLSNPTKYLPVCLRKQAQSWPHASWIVNGGIFAKKLLPVNFWNTDKKEKEEKNTKVTAELFALNADALINRLLFVTLFSSLHLLESRRLLGRVWVKEYLKNLLTNSFPMHPFLTPQNTSENRKVFWSFQAVEKGCIGNWWVNFSFFTEYYYFSRNYINFFRRVQSKHVLWLKSKFVFLQSFAWLYTGQYCDKTKKLTVSKYTKAASGRCSAKKFFLVAEGAVRSCVF